MLSVFREVWQPRNMQISRKNTQISRKLYKKVVSYIFEKIIYLYLI